VHHVKVKNDNIWTTESMKILTQAKMIKNYYTTTFINTKSQKNHIKSQKIIFDFTKVGVKFHATGVKWWEI